MLLTATATQRVRIDILKVMELECKDNNGHANQKVNAFSRLDDKLSKRAYTSHVNNSKSNKECAFFMQSFNRENLQYKANTC